MAYVMSYTSDIKGMVSELPGNFYQADGTMQGGAVFMNKAYDAAGKLDLELLWSTDGVNYSSIYTESINLKQDNINTPAILMGTLDANAGTVTGTLAGGNLSAWFATDGTGHWKYRIAVSGKIVDFSVDLNGLQGAAGAALSGYKMLGNGHGEVEMIWSGT